MEAGKGIPDLRCFLQWNLVVQFVSPGRGFIDGRGIVFRKSVRLALRLALRRRRLTDADAVRGLALERDKLRVERDSLTDPIVSVVAVEFLDAVGVRLVEDDASGLAFDVQDHPLIITDLFLTNARDGHGDRSVANVIGLEPLAGERVRYFHSGSSFRFGCSLQARHAHGSV